MKKLLLVSRNFPPLVGGMERLNYYLFCILKKHFNVEVAGPEGAGLFLENCNSVEFPYRPLWKYILYSFIKAAFFSFKKKYAIVLCGSGTAIIAGYACAKLTSAKLVCYLHGLDIVAKSWIYQFLFVMLIKKSDLLLVNSEHTRKLAIKAGMDQHKIRVLNPGVEIPNLEKADFYRAVFREKHHLYNRPVILIVGRLTERKGVAEFIENVMPELVVKHPQIMCVVIGGEPVGALNSKSGAVPKIDALIKSYSLTDNVVLLGQVDDNCLESAYFASDLMVFPVLDLPGDVEGFGMVAIESAAHGLPTIAFSVGGVLDAISSGESGWLIPSGDYQLMRGKISEFFDASEFTSNLKCSCRDFAERFSWANFEKKLIKFLAFQEK